MKLLTYIRNTFYHHIGGKTSCPICGKNVQKYWELRYNGYRGTCTICNTNWAES